MPPALGATTLTSIALTEWQDGQPVVSVSRGDVRELQVAYGFFAERLLFQLFFAVGIVVICGVLTAGGLLGLLPGKVLFCAPAIGLGGWMAHHVFERGFIVNVTTLAGDRRKLRLGNDPELATAFVAEARRLGWTVAHHGPFSR